MTVTGRRRFLAGALCVALWPVPAAALSVYVAENGQVFGPFDAAALKDRLGSRDQAAGTQVWMQGMPSWRPATEVPALAGLIAELPMVPAFEPNAFLIGSWRSEEHAIKVGTVALMGRVSFSFAADGRFTGSLLGLHTRMIPEPAPGGLQMGIETLQINSLLEGSYTVHEGTDGFFLVDMKGKETSQSRESGGKVNDWAGTLEVRRMGPSHMRTRHAVDYRKTGD